MSDISIHHHRTISAVDRDDWDRLGGHTGFTSHGWLSAVETYGIHRQQWHFLVARLDGVLCAAMVLRLEQDSTTNDSIAYRLFGGGARRSTVLGRVLGSCLIAGVTDGYGGELLSGAWLDRDTRTRVTSVLLDNAEALSRELGASLWFPGVMQRDTDLLFLLRENRYFRAHYLPLAEIRIRWDSFEDYLDWQRSRSRKLGRNIRRERERCRAAGVSLTENEDLSRHDRHLMELANQTLQRYGSARFPFRPGFFQSLRENLGDRFMTGTAVRDGRIVGFATLISDGETAWADCYGLDYARAAASFTYFNLTHYWPIEKAIEQGLARVVFGRGQYEAKLRRGCELTDTFLCRSRPSRPFSVPMRAYFSRLDKHYLAEVQAQIPRSD